MSDSFSEAADRIKAIERQVADGFGGGTRQVPRSRSRVGAPATPRSRVDPAPATPEPRTSWESPARTEPVASAARPGPTERCEELLVGVTTFNRLSYLRRFVSTFAATKNDRYAWTLVIADDGSTDGTLSYARELELPGVHVVVIENKARGIAGQTNAVFGAARSIGFDLGFKCDDDIFFDQRGWDDLYVEAIAESGVEHLVFHDPSWKAPSHDERRGPLRSSVSALECMGCLYTFTPRLLEEIGFLDELNFPVRGHAHIDFTVRACRAGFNDATHLWDAEGSSERVGMWSRDQYIQTIDWRAPEVVAALSDDERSRRAAVIAQPERRYVPWTDPQPWRPGSRVAVRGARGEGLGARLGAIGRFRRPAASDALFDQAFVLNLRHQLARFNRTAAQLAGLGIPFERWPGVDGNSDDVVQRWRRYAAAGATTALERQIGRRAIQSPGAWAYMLGMRSLIKEAKRRRLRRIALFDDDVFIHRDFCRLLTFVERELPDDFSLLFLGATQREWDKVRPYSDHLYHPDEKTDGSYAVVIDHSVFDLLIERINAFEAPFDAGPLRDVVISAGHQCFAALPSLVVPDVSISDIRKARDQGEMARIARWKLADYPRLDQPRRERLSYPTASVLIDVAPYEWPSSGLFTSLRSQTIADFEIVILDRSDDPYIRGALQGAALADPRIRLLLGDPHMNEGAALTAMVAAARSDVVVPQSPLAIPSGDRVERCLAVLDAEPAAIAVEARIDLRDDATGIRDPAEAIPMSEGPPERSERWIVAGAIRASVFEGLGSALAAGEDGLREVVHRRALHETRLTGEDVEAGVAALDDELLIVPATSIPDRVFGEDENPDWLLFHEEVRAGLRPVHVTPVLTAAPAELHVEAGA